MNIYLVKRTTYIDWDEFAEMVIVAKDEDSARLLFRNKAAHGRPIEDAYEDYIREDPLTVELVNTDQEGVVSVDFKAG